LKIEFVSLKSLFFKIIFPIFALCAAIGSLFLHSEINSAEAQNVESVTFVVEKGVSASDLAYRLERENIIRNASLFRWYLSWKKIDTRIQSGTYIVNAPITMSRVAGALLYDASRQEKKITIIPGWTLRDIAVYLEKEGWGSMEEVYAVTGKPAELVNMATRSTWGDLAILREKPRNVSLEGYLAPETFQVFSDSTMIEIIEKLLKYRDQQFTPQMIADIEKGKRTIHEILTMASMIEREVPHKEDMKKVADIFWKRFYAGWGMQADSTVHYIFGKKGDLFTTRDERASENAWNTYKYAGLPPGPICSPSLDAIMAAIYPEKNDAWYFLTTLDTGEVKYGKTLEEHQRNVVKYLR